MGCFHILIDLCDWQNIVDVIIIYDICQHPNEDCECAVFKIGQLNIHRTKFYPPANLGVLRRRWLEPKRVPICGLKIFKMRMTIHGRNFCPPFGEHTLTD